MYVRSVANPDGTVGPIKYGPDMGIVGGLEVVPVIPWNNEEQTFKTLTQTIPVYECE